MNNNVMGSVAMRKVNEYKKLLDAITLEFNDYKNTVHLDYQAMNDALESLGSELLALKNKYEAHTHSYTDIDDKGVTLNKVTQVTT